MGMPRGAIEERYAIVTHDPLPSVRADATQLAQLFQNLVVNALNIRVRAHRRSTFPRSEAATGNGPIP
jgi:light-regulated signal transduction histidine kinase (bacteriophytochrome)